MAKFIIKSTKKIINNNLSIYRKPNYGFKIIGKEFDKRLCIIKYLYRDLIQFEEIKEIEIIADIILEGNKEFNVKMSEITFEFFLKYVYVSIYRSNLGITINDTLTRKEQLSSATIKVVMKIIKDISKELSIEFCEAEQYYLAVFYGASIASDSYSDFGPNFVISSEINELVLRMLESVYETLSIDFRNDFELIMSLNQHMVPTDIRLRYNILIVNPLLKKIKKEYAVAYTIANNAVLPLRDYYQGTINEDEIGFIALLFALSIEKSQRNYSRKNIIIVCATGKGSSQLFSYRFKKQNCA